MASKDKAKPAIAPAEPAASPLPNGDAPATTRAFIRSTHGLPRGLRASSGEVMWFTSTGEEHHLDAETLAAAKVDPILQVTEIDAPAVKPANVAALDTMPSLEAAMSSASPARDLPSMPSMPREPVLSSPSGKTPDAPKQLHVSKDEAGFGHVSGVNPKDE